jgi:hypothetical protein
LAESRAGGKQALSPAAIIARRFIAEPLLKRWRRL